MGARAIKVGQVGRGLLAWVLALGAGMGGAMPVVAQSLNPEERDAFLADPLTDDPRDSLLPEAPPVLRPLSPLELYGLERTLPLLPLVEALLDETGQTNEVVDLWLRESRLWRLLGLEAELAALPRLAQNLNRSGNPQAVQLLTARVEQLEFFFDPGLATNRAALLEIADLYLLLAAPRRAIALHHTLADTARTNGDLTAYLARTESIAEIQAAWFYFPDAVATYMDLAQLAQSMGDANAQAEYLRQAIANAEQAQNFELAITLQQQLQQVYGTHPAMASRQPALFYELGQNYQAVGNGDAAQTTYQSAYSSALALLQFDVAAAALTALADLYAAAERWPEVLYLYEQQLRVTGKTYDAYGLMDTYDRIGQTYEQLDQPEAAIAAYREALTLGRSLGHREDYFDAQIQRVQAGPPMEPAPDPDSDLDSENNAPPPTPGPSPRPAPTFPDLDIPQGDLEILF